jgi:histidinol dehydrogenase
MIKLRRETACNWTFERSQTVNAGAWESVQEIVEAVREQGHEAVARYTAKFDGLEEALRPDYRLRVPKAQLQAAWEGLPESLQGALSRAADRIRQFHEQQVRTDIRYTGPDGARLGLVYRPLRRVGVYAPGGRAAYPSTALMNVIPAQVAGVTDIVLLSPPSPDSGYPHPLILAAAYLVGIEEVYRVGGAQAIAALAYGTDELKPVDKIAGPGNLYVALAKRAVMGDVGIDSIAGPSEVFIVAESGANPEYIAADMLAQAEHDPEAASVCVTTDASLIEPIEKALTAQLAQLERREMAMASLEKWGAVVVADSLEEAIDLVNRCAPEHVELMLAQPYPWLDKLETAGAVFIGESTPEPVGDYYAGTNHVLPTHGSARFASGLGVDDFVRRMSYVAYTPEVLRAHGADIMALAQAEGLTAHAKSVEVRMREASRNG